MADIIINDVTPREQFVALADQILFTVSFNIFKETDIKVYKTPAGNPADETADILILNVGYVVTLLATGGDVTLTAPASAGDIITILRDLPVERTTDFNVGGFTVDELNGSLDTIVATIQDREMVEDKVSPSYDQNAQIASPKDLKLPLLGNGQFWKMNETGTGIQASTLEENTDVDTLRSDLADDQSGTDGARLIGFQSTLTGSTTVHDQLEANSILTSTFSRKNLIIGGNFTTNPWQREITFSPIGNNNYSADRFVYVKTGTMVHDIDQSLIVPTVAQAGLFSVHSLRMNCTTAQASLGVSDFTTLTYRMEGFDWSQIYQKQFTLSFMVRTTKTGVYSIGLQNQGLDRYLVSEFVVNTANTFEKKTITFPAAPNTGTWNFNNSVGLRIDFVLAAGADLRTPTLDVWQSGTVEIASTNQVNACDAINNEFIINFVQLEVGVTATSFELRPRQEEFELCQRYFEKSYSVEAFPGEIATGGTYKSRHALMGNTLFIDDSVYYTIPKLGSPAVTFFDPTTGSAGVWRIEGQGTIPVVGSNLIKRGFHVTGTQAAPGNEVFLGQWVSESEL